MSLVASTLLDLVKNMRAFAGILVVSEHQEGCMSSCPSSLQQFSQMTLAAIESTCPNFSNWNNWYG